MSDEDFRRLVFAGLLSIQYHPRNDVTPDLDEDVIHRCLQLTELSVAAFGSFFYASE